MEAYLDGLPRSTSAMSLSTSNSSSNLDQQSAPTSSRSTSSSYWTSGISSVWSGLKAAAGVEVKGFLKAVQGIHKVGGDEQRDKVGDKRARREQESATNGTGEAGMDSEAQAKRRKTDSDSAIHTGERYSSKGADYAYGGRRQLTAYISAVDSIVRFRSQRAESLFSTSILS